MKKGILYTALLVGFAALSVTGCKKKSTTPAAADATAATTTTTTETTTATGAYLKTNVPSQLKVATPSTLNKAATTAAKMMGAPASPNFGAAATKTENDAEGLKQAQETTDAMKQVMKQVEMNMMFVDAAIQDGSIKLATDSTTGCQGAGVVKFKFTQAMFDAMKAEMAGYGLTDAEVATELTDMKAMIGKEMTGPPIHYYNATVLGAAGKGIQVGDMPAEGAPVTVSGCTNGMMDAPTEIISWSDDKKKVTYKAVFAMGATDKMQVMATYDGTTKISSFEEKGNISFPDENGVTQKGSFAQKGKFRECGAAKDNCVDFKVYTEVAQSGFKFKYDVRGRADNKGGFAKGKQFFTFNGLKDAMWMKEYFGADKKLTGLYFADNVSGKDCFKNDKLCTWNSVIAPTGDSIYEASAEDTTPGNKAFVFTLTKTLATTDDGEYMLIDAGTTDKSPQATRGQIVIENREVIVSDVFIPPATSGVKYDLYKQTGFDEKKGIPTFGAKFDTVTVTF